LKYYDSQQESDLKSDALFDVVMIAVKAGDAGEIIKEAEEYLKKYPNGDNYSKVLVILADTYGSNGRVPDAVKLLQGYLASAQPVDKPNSANFLLGFYQQLSGDSDQALAAYAKVDPQKEGGKFYFGALKNSAIIYLTEKKEDQAKSYFDRLISQTGQNDLQIKTYIWVCNEYIKEQKYKDALRIALEAEKNFPAQDLVEIKYFEAESLRGMGSCDEADKDYNIVLSSPQKNQYTGSAHIGYGLCLEQANKPDEAKAQFQRSLDENADDFTITAHARFETANVDVSQGNYDEALKFYLLIATIYEDDYYCPESLLRAGQVLEHLKRNGDAQKLYAEIQDKYKNSKEAVTARERAGLLK
jgi:tetratricopeptide (TPR) repeat protein